MAMTGRFDGWDNKNNAVDRTAILAILALVTIALMVRLPEYGDPDVHLDEQFYLLVGDRMWQGALPYVDIWDRKPIGLFLIYAFARAFGGEGVIQYQILASLFAGSTAGVIWIMARRSANNLASFLAGLCYLFWLNMFGGGVGQSPVFYNLLIAIAALLALRSNDSITPRQVTLLGVSAMILCGLSLQIKYTAVVESIYIGCWFLWRLWQTTRDFWRIVATALTWAIIGILPTAMVAAYYAAVGHIDAFVFANFVSIFQRGYLGDAFVSRALSFYLIAPLPLTLCIPLGLLQRWQQRNTLETRDLIFLGGWLLSAFVGFIMIGNYYDHYALPLLVPIFVIIAPLLRRPFVGITLTAIFIGYVAFARFPNYSYIREKRDKTEELAKAALPYVTKKCLFIFDGPSIIYMKTKACLSTKFAYSDHFVNSVENGAIGVDNVNELRRIFDSKPGAIITAEAPVIPRINAGTLQLLRKRLPRDYVLVSSIDHPDRTYYVYALRSLTHGQGVKGPVPYEGYEVAHSRPH